MYSIAHTLKNIYFKINFIFTVYHIRCTFFTCIFKAMTHILRLRCTYAFLKFDYNSPD